MAFEHEFEITPAKFATENNAIATKANLILKLKNHPK